MSNLIIILRENKEIIISLLTCILALVGLFIKRKPKTLDEFTLIVSDVLSYVPVLVSKVEEAGNGEKKKRKVIESCLILVSSKMNRKLTEKEKAFVSSAVSEQIEDVLEAPQKKLC